ncbi:hypothetical protein GLYMA_08G101901v4 [Glycine max]|nr:hypothetical protein GLYMA_08G101901v4 [Glycine max]KAH1050519.1 hypothetical protein GYH30_020813 [Glycine max]
MVVLCLPQHHCHGWCWCPHPSLCHVYDGLGSGDSYTALVMDDHVVYPMANG